LQNENQSFLEAVSKTRPVLKGRITATDAQLVKVLGQLASAERAHNMLRIASLAAQASQINAQLQDLHVAQGDLTQMEAFASAIDAGMKSENPSGELCQGGKCASVPPLVAIGTILTAGLVGELNKKEPFGPNNEIMKSLHSIGDFVKCIFGC
jgi:hypothetical protein